MIQEQLKYC